MWGKKSCCKSKKLCPVSFGLAVGVTGFLCALIGTAWAMLHGAAPEMVQHYMTVPLTWGTSFAFAFMWLVKGFIFGFLIALFYDLFCCCCKASCCKQNGTGERCGCGCGCSGCSCGMKSSGTTSDQFGSKL